jgi:hypothetical protein
MELPRLYWIATRWKGTTRRLRISRPVTAGPAGFARYLATIARHPLSAVRDAQRISKAIDARKAHTDVSRRYGLSLIGDASGAGCSRCRIREGQTTYEKQSSRLLSIDRR